MTFEMLFAAFMAGFLFAVAILAWLERKPDA